MSLDEDIKKAFGIEKENRMLKIAEDRLHPPKPITNEKFAIDFNNLDPKYQKWALSLETQRHYYYTKFGKTHRKDTEGVKKDLEEKEIELDAIEVMKKQKTPAFMGVINEFRAKVAKIKEKRVDDE